MTSPRYAVLAALRWAYAPGPTLYLTAIALLAVAFADRYGPGPTYNGMGVGPSGSAAFLFFWPLGVLMATPTVRAWVTTFRGDRAIYRAGVVRIVGRLIAGVVCAFGLAFYAQTATIGTLDESLSYAVVFSVPSLVIAPEVMATLQGVRPGSRNYLGELSDWIRSIGRARPTSDRGTGHNSSSPPPGNDIPRADEAHPNFGPMPHDYATACAVLGIPLTAEYERARTVRDALAKANHPDIAPNPRERIRSEAVMTRINIAWSIIEEYHKSG